MLHELWRAADGGLSFFPVTNTEARGRVEPDGELIWTVEAPSYFAAMTAFYVFMDWGEYRSEWQELDSKPYL